MSSDHVDCPLCFRPFPTAQIERHAANCTGLNSATGASHDNGPAANHPTAAFAPPPSPPASASTPDHQPSASANATPASGTAAPTPEGMTQCPMCNRDFPTLAIEQHASMCTGAGGGNGGDTTALGQCHARCGRPGNGKYGGYCLTCLNRRGGTASLRPRMVHRQSLTGRNVDVCVGDITLESAEAIVNPANSKLDHASGVAGAIARAAGPELEDDCDALIAGLPDHRLPTGDAAITRAGGSLQCRWVIHAVGPTWKGGSQGEPAALAACVRKSLSLAHEKRLLSIAMPAISSGIFGYPKDRCARDIIDAVFAFLNDHPDTSLRSIRLTNVDDDTVEVFKSALGTEPRPTCSLVRWVAGSEDKKQVLRVMHGSPYRLYRSTTGIDGALHAAPPGVAVVDFCNLGWDLITPYIDDDELRIRLQQSLRNSAAADGLTKPDGAADPVRAFAVRDTALTDVRVAVAACASNKFDEASFNRLVQSAQVAIVMAANTQAPVVAVPLLAANTLGFTNTHSARAVIEASRSVLSKRAELGLPALEINLCEGVDTAFFVDVVRTTFVAKPAQAGAKDPGASVLAQVVEPAPLVFSAAAAAGSSDPSSPASGTDGASSAVAAAPADPPAKETPKERRARLCAEAEAKLAMRLASENP